VVSFDDGGSPATAVAQSSADNELEVSSDRMVRLPHMARMDVSISERDYTKGFEMPVTIPESTHTFLFSEDVNSVPFAFSLVIAAISYTLLIMALIYNLNKGTIPKNVVGPVAVAQYMGVLISLLMEGEIPTAIYLLRRISKPYLKTMFPEVGYSRFILSCLLRLSMGYLFLVNVIVILICADGVIDIFYDVLALQFIQQLDDIAFAISKMQVLGREMQVASMKPIFEKEFEKQHESLALKWRSKVALKAVYFINLAVFLVIMGTVTVKQSSGDYQARSIMFRFGDEVWDESYVLKNGRKKKMTLVYAHFTGEYEMDDDHISFTEGRPVYVERNKVSGSPYKSTGPTLPQEWPLVSEDFIIEPAEIRYCGKRWIFTHKQILKSNMHEDLECAWLARSEETDSFDLLDVSSTWELWTGAIQVTSLSIIETACKGNSDCNYNGNCVNEKCECDNENGPLFLGKHCEIKLKPQCSTITYEVSEATWKVEYESGSVLSQYSHPVYFNERGMPSKYQLNSEYSDEHQLALVYSGLRWFMYELPHKRYQDPTTIKSWNFIMQNWHSYWFQGSFGDLTVAVSDPTSGNSPVGVDFYRIAGRSHQFGPFGSLEPMQLNNETGRGSFSCELAEEDSCNFCRSNGVVNEDLVVSADGQTCGSVFEKAKTIEQVSNECGGVSSGNGVMPFEVACCPEDTLTNGRPCPFCENGLSVDGSYPFFGDYTCGQMLKFARHGHFNSTVCEEMLWGQSICCPDSSGNAVPASCPFCTNGLDASLKDVLVPEFEGETCSSLKDWALVLQAEEENCFILQFAEYDCCPAGGNDANAGESMAQDEDEDGGGQICNFCSGEVSEAKQNEIVPNTGGATTCSDLVSYSLTLAVGGAECDQILPAQALCCPGEI